MTLKRRIVGEPAAVLQAGKQYGGSVVHANAGSNATGGTIPAYADYLHIYASVPFRVSVGEATSGSLGIPLAPNVSHRLMVERSGGTLHTQTIGTAGTIHYGYTEGV